MGITGKQKHNNAELKIERPLRPTQNAGPAAALESSHRMINVYSNMDIMENIRIPNAHIQDRMPSLPVQNALEMPYPRNKDM
jgi:hypothetical protein